MFIFTVTVVSTFKQLTLTFNSNLYTLLHATIPDSHCRKCCQKKLKLGNPWTARESERSCANSLASSPPEKQPNSCSISLSLSLSLAINCRTLSRFALRHFRAPRSGSRKAKATEEEEEDVRC